MEPNTQQVPGYFVWESPGTPVVVHLRLDMIDRMGAEIMRGFGAVPKRGAEVGGILLGAVEPGDKTIVRVEDFVPVATTYSRGPSYLLSDEERSEFTEAVSRARAGDRPAPVGYFRSHTRDGAMSLGPEDLELLGPLFPTSNDIVLLVRPFATKVSIGGVLVRTNGNFPQETPFEFPFRRRELMGEDAPPRRSLEERAANRPRRQRPEMGVSFEPEEPLMAPPPTFGASSGYTEAPPAARPAPAKRGGLWLPLCLLFLILGVALGYQLALTFAPGLQQRQGTKAFELDLTAGRNGNSLMVHWDRDSAAVLAAERGMLEIQDGEESHTLQLNPAQLKEGSVVYQNASLLVQFRLVIYLDSNLTVAETVEWQ